MVEGSGSAQHDVGEQDVDRYRQQQDGRGTTQPAALALMRIDTGGGQRLVSRQPAASASSTEQNQRVPLEIFIWIFAYQRLVGW